MTGDRINYNTFEPYIRRVTSPDYPTAPVPSGLSPEAELAAEEIIKVNQNMERTMHYKGDLTHRTTLDSLEFNTLLKLESNAETLGIEVWDGFLDADEIAALSQDELIVIRQMIDEFSLYEEEFNQQSVVDLIQSTMSYISTPEDDAAFINAFNSVPKWERAYDTEVEGHGSKQTWRNVFLRWVPVGEEEELKKIEALYDKSSYRGCNLWQHATNDVPKTYTGAFDWHSLEQVRNAERVKIPSIA